MGNNTGNHAPVDTGGSLLDLTLAAATKDRPTVKASGELIQRITEGVRFWPVPTHVDNRGTLVELFDPRWGWHSDPLVFAYASTLRPGYVKGWGLHKKHEDRYFVIQGEMEVVLYDPRPESSTYGEVCTIILSEYNRRLMNIPRNVWHADHNIGAKDTVLLSFPTMMYDHDDPDKYRLPVDTPLIPHSFKGARGW